MRQVPNGKRSRNRPGRNNRQPNSRNQTYDSNGPEGRVRGTANQVYEKYLALGRDAHSSGDRIAAENFFQHAEHYFRILSVNGQQTPRPRPMNGFGGEFEDDDSELSASERGEQQPARFGQGPQPDVKAEPSSGPASNGPAANGRNSHGEASEGEAQPQSRRETPAELAKAAEAKSEQAKSEQRPQRERGRRGRRGENTGAEAAS